MPLIADVDGFDAEALLAQAQRLSLTTGPPNGWKQDQPLVLHRPPYPTEDLMRQSRLFQVMNVNGSAADTVGDTELKFENANVSSIIDRAHHGASHQEQEASFFDLDLNPDLL